MARADMQYLEWNGPTLRVRLRVSKKALSVIGKQFLKQSLGHGSLARAQIEKHAVLAKLRHEIREAEREAARRAGADPLELEALAVREELRAAERERKRIRGLAPTWGGGNAGGTSNEEDGDEERPQGTIEDAIEGRIYDIERKEGTASAHVYADIVYGRATPLSALLEKHLEVSEHGAKFKGLTRRALKRLEQWCEETQTPKTVEALNAGTAAQFEEEALTATKVQPATFNSYRSALSGYWDWLIGRGAATSNPWKGRKSRRAKPHRVADPMKKRPFDDSEVEALLAGKASQRLHDVMTIAALSGMRLGEIVGLRVKHCAEGCFVVARGKTKAGQRVVPIHSALAPTIARLIEGREGEGSLVAGLEEPPEGSERSKASPLSKEFTRYRRKLKIDERSSTHPQSAIDFHSFRRWFIRKRVEALEAGAKGFTAWTLADVVGHDKEDGPLAMTMGRYPGSASETALRACVEAAGLPEAGNHVPKDRDA